MPATAVLRAQRRVPAVAVVPIARVALPVAAHTVFDYWAPDALPIERGNVVHVRLGPRKLTGVVIAVADSTTVPQDKLQSIVDVAAMSPLPADVLDLAEFTAAYYQEPIGMALALAVPPLAVRNTLRRGPDVRLVLTETGRRELPLKLARAPASRLLLERFTAAPAGISVAVMMKLAPHARRTITDWRERGFVASATAPAALEIAAPHAFNADQREAVNVLAAAHGSFAPFVLYGVTGSGKTDVYLEVARQAIDKGGQVLLLVPEINLTPQLEQRVRAALPGVNIATLHSALADGERRNHWRAAASGEAELVLGTRLAVFAPLPHLALVIVDEEHDVSYKQQDGVRYQARDVAVWRAHRRGVPVVLGSATPSLESWLHAQDGRYRRLDLPRRADPRAAMPVVRLADNRPARALEGICEEMRAALHARLARGEQSLVFVNRRGFAPSLLCSACRWEADCPRCSARLVVHRGPDALRCHHCGHGQPLPRACPECGNVDLLPLGFGTQRLERVLAQAFPAARIARVDRDSTRAKGAFAAMRAQVAANELDILIGTQMLAKGHDFPRLTLVGVLGADNALYSADFRATERLAALLMQVAGRAGRAGLPGEVIVQTDFPEHPVFAALAAHDFDRFAAALLAERRVAQLPPYAHVALLAAEAHLRDDVDEFLRLAHAEGERLAREHESVEVFSPVPALLARRAGFERGQLVVQGTRRVVLQRFLTAWRAAVEAIPGRRVRWGLDVDPAGFA
jgi:primosomal protein N' (replication factor Y) (superfamily II helicase)